MPSAMIHLLIAYEADPEAPDLFWFGNVVPDYTDYRTKTLGGTSSI